MSVSQNNLVIFLLPQGDIVSVVVLNYCLEDTICLIINLMLIDPNHPEEGEEKEGLFSLSFSLFL